MIVIIITVVTIMRVCIFVHASIKRKKRRTLI